MSTHKIAGKLSKGGKIVSKILKKALMLTLSFIIIVELLVSTSIPIEAATKNYVKGLKVTKNSVKLYEGENAKINATVKAVGSAKKTVRAKTSSSTVAQVKTGKT